MIFERAKLAVAVVGESACRVAQHAVRENECRRCEVLHAFAFGWVAAVGLRLVGRTLHDFFDRIEVEPSPAARVALKRTDRDVFE